MILRLCVLALLIFSTSPAWATTYYVATTGSDSNNGTAIGTPFLTIQKGVNAATQPDDIVTVANGTYTPINGTCNYVAYIASGETVCGVSMTAGTGTAGHPITLKSTTRLGAKIQLGTVASQGNNGIYIKRAYWVIDGFEILGVNSSNAVYGQTGIVVSASHTTIQLNVIHDIAKNTCYSSANGNGGIYFVNTLAFATIDRNVIYSIGRRRNGESGCSTSVSFLDHGLYIDDFDNVDVTRNIFYDDVRGWPITVYTGTGGTTSNLTIYHNTFSDKPAPGTPNPAEGQVLLSVRVTNVTIKNNISYDPQVGMVRCSGSIIPTNVLVDHNLSSALIKNSECTGNVTFTNNTENTSPGFVNVGARDYTLASGSAAINNGVAILGLAYNGAAPDDGAFETFVFSVCTVEDGDASNLRITYQTNVFPPLFPASGVTGITARKAGANDPVTTGTVISTTRVDRTLTNAIVNGNTVDISTAATNLTDSALIGGTLNQPYVQTLTNQSCTNNVGAASTYQFEQHAFRFNGLRGTEAAPVATPYASAPESTNVFVRVGGSVRLRASIKNSVQDPPPTGFLWYYSRNAGAYSLMSNTFGADNVAYCGTGPDADIPQDFTATTNQLSTTGTFAAGALLRTSNAVPTVDIVLNGKTEIEGCFSWDTDTAPGDTYDFRLRQQDGTVLNTYTVTPRATIAAERAGMGF